LASSGYKVTGVDLNKKKVDVLSKGKLPFDEPGLEQLFKKGFKNFVFSTNVQPADVFIISVPTPITENKRPDLSFVKQAAKDINKVIKSGNLVVVESTVPPGAAEKIVLPILKSNRKNLEIYLSHAPERAIPGKTLKEMSRNDRIVGGINEQSARLTKEIYSSFVKGKIYTTSATTAEFVKLTENSFRDINIAFANELAKICDEIGINIWEAIKLANLHPRVNIHLPGPGVGGHCLAVDPWFLIRRGSNGAKFIKLARNINDSMPNYTISCVSRLLRGIKKPTITVLGAAYKANVDDWRESPALRVIKIAQKKGWQVKVHDPYVTDFPFKIEKGFNEAVKDSDCLVLITNHDFYKEVDPTRIKNMRSLNIFDARNCIDKQKWQKVGFRVDVLGENGLNANE
jgi:UDP-N-acetyl-D-mannosaminuronic acid dehydrogenase